MGFYRGPHIVTDGLVLYLDSRNTKSYNSGSLVWSDLARNNINSSLQNITFNINDFSIGLINSSSKVESIMQSINTSNFSILFTVQLKQTFNQIEIKTRETNTHTQAPESTVRYNTFCITFSKLSNIVTERLYINGEEVRASNYTNLQFNLISPVNLKVLCNNATGTSNIKNLSIYNKTLTPSEILQNYRSFNII
jgi:hypothetical protein